MPPGIPGVDLVFLTRITQRLAVRSLHTYCPGSRRSAAALVLRFDDDTQESVTSAMSAFRAATQRRGHAASKATGFTEKRAVGSAALSRGRILSSSVFSSSATCASSSVSRDSTEGGYTDPLRFFEYLANGHGHRQEDIFVDTAGSSALQLLFLKRANMNASRWSGGQVAFPGGRRDPDDHDDFDTVCRQTYEELGFPLRHHHQCLCLGRLPDCRLHSRPGDYRGLVQARFVFLHVGDNTPTVQFAAHEVESVRWVPLRALTSANVERGHVVHSLKSFVKPQDADARLLLEEVFPNTYVSFPSVRLPGIPLSSPSFSTAGGANRSSDDGASPKARERVSSASSVSPSWQVWGLTLRSTHELLALGNHQVFEWPLVESNSRLLQYGVIFPLHGYYELLYQLYWWRAWVWAKICLLDCGGCAADRGETKAVGGQHGSDTLGSSRSGWSPPKSLCSPPSREQQRLRHVLFGSSMERRYAILPLSADALLFAAPEMPAKEHVVSFATALCIAVFLLYTVAAAIASVCATVGAALGQAAELSSDARSRAYCGASPARDATPHHSSVAGGGGGDHQERGSPNDAMADGNTPSNDEADVFYPGWHWQPRDHRAPHVSATADEAALSAVLCHGFTNILTGKSNLSNHSAVSPAATHEMQNAAMSDTQQHLTSTTLTEMHPTPTGTRAAAEALIPSPSQATTTSSPTMTSSLPSNASVDMIAERCEADGSHEWNVRSEQAAGMGGEGASSRWSCCL
ncbi:hypothetical protein JKF63_06397 [Porcisia hertigi]|uniref:Nudix hydrolase domain-containing protein n=1 Tax=Porcisia hertigi TaxID=2761500 RepID=A0A836LJU8_9TRYP|nr:hypothetical protein JKF63_06397 [Porcisia hertigi]